MQNKPMKLDLSDFFADERKCSLILIDVSWQNIKNLQDHIQNLFHLNGISLLTGDGAFLPPKESIEVLRNAGSLKAFQFKTPVDDQTIAEVASTKKISKKRKKPSSDLELASSTPNHPKRSKSYLNLNETCSLLPITQSVSRRSENKKKQAKRQKETISPDEDLEIDTEAEEEEITNKENTLRISVVETINTTNVRESLSVSKQSKNLDSSEREEVEDMPKDRVYRRSEVIFRCALMELKSEAPRIFKLPRLKPPVKILENILIPANALQASEETEIEPVRWAVETSQVEDQTFDPKIETNSSEIETNNNEKDSTEKEETIVEPEADNIVLHSDSEDAIMVLDDSDSDVESVIPVVGSEKTDTADVILDLLQSGVSLSDLPNKGDTLVFKLAKVKGSQILGKTEFLAGTCTYVNRRTKCITITMISYPKYLCRVLRQYRSNLDDTEGVSPVLNVSMKDLIEANVCVSTVD